MDLWDFLGKFFWTFALLINLDESCIFVSRIFRSRAPNLGVLCTPDRPPFVWSLAGEVGRAVLSGTQQSFISLCWIGSGSRSNHEGGRLVAGLLCFAGAVEELYGARGRPK